MATGHLNPGYGDIVSRYRRVRSAGEGGVGGGGGGGLTDPGMDRVREEARQAWLRPDKGQTSYSDHFKYRPVDESTRSRPTSPGRRNKPHPPLVFLTCALHTVPGYHNPDALTGKDAYRIDALLPPEERQQRADLRRKYQTGRPSTAMLQQFNARPGEREFINNMTETDMPDIWRPRMVTPSAGPRERQRMDSVMRHLDEDASYEYQPPMIASHHRYLRPAGYEEALYLTGQGQPLGAMRAADRVARRNARATHGGQSKRGDFLMHPEWGPNFSHHRLNGLSSADRPFSSTRRNLTQAF